MITRQEAARRIAARELADQKKRVQIMAFDPSKPPTQSDASSLLGEVAQLLGVDPSDADALTKAFARLVEAAGVDSTPEQHFSQPKQTDQNAVRRGARMLGWARK
jgi:ABC-type sugar transport system substrate-binding protein